MVRVAILSFNIYIGNAKLLFDIVMNALPNATIESMLTELIAITDWLNEFKEIAPTEEIESKEHQLKLLVDTLQNN